MAPSALDLAIDTAAPERLCALVKQACLKSEAVKDIFSEFLLVPETAIATAWKRNLVEFKDGSSEADSEAGSTEGSSEDDEPPHNKRRKIMGEPEPSSLDGHDTLIMRPRYAVCDQCNEDFDEMENHDKACHWHSGELEVDYDSWVWADHYEPIEELVYEKRNEYPEGFNWSCCGEDGVSNGCETGRHKRESDQWRTPQADLRAAGFPG